VKGSFHLADWEIHPQINCVTRGNSSHHLEPKVMQVLVYLASKPNEVLSKEELMHTVWADTFVGDDVLTRSISEIRRALEDDARAPKFIQTIPKVGYRLIVPVAFEPVAATIASVATAQTSDPASTAVDKEAGKTSYRWLAWVGISVVIVLLGYWGIRRVRLGGTAHDEQSYKTVPFTSNLGAESQPAFSPDTKQIAFVWKREEEKFRHVYVKLIGSETQLQLTSGEADDFNPVWSPDGTSVAFLRLSGADRGILVVPAIGGAARKLYTPEARADLKEEWEHGALSWSPDGRQLIFPDGKTSHGRSMIYALDLGSMQAKPITFPSVKVDGDYCPVYSPDGNRIAFTRGTEGFVRDVYVMDANGGNPRRLTVDNRYVSSLTWTADGSAIIFSSDRAGKTSLWRVEVSGGEPRRLPFGEDALAPAISRGGEIIAYAQRSAKWSIFQVSLSTSPQSNAVRRLLSSTEQDSAPRFSPDGKHIAFQSWRSGTQEIWTCSSLGTDLAKLTSYGGPLTGSPSWSPDGQQIAFDSRPGGHSHIYVIGMNGGAARAITTGEYNDIVPNWSPEGRWIYFGSNRSGNWQIWKVPSNGGDPQQVTRQGGFVGMPSVDGRWVYFAKNDRPGIWRVPVEGGDETEVMQEPALGNWASWTLSGAGIYYLRESDQATAIELLHLDTGRTERVHSLERAPSAYSGVTVTADGKSLVYTDLTEAGSHITLVQNFR
jgi:Tol biopolymer transport system component/DNA-binding winged helix-turn-helix (wHTH) protein